MKRLLTHQVAQRLNRTPAGVRAMERRGVLRVIWAGGLRLYSEAQVEKVARHLREREAGAENRRSAPIARDTAAARPPVPGARARGSSRGASGV